MTLGKMAAFGLGTALIFSGCSKSETVEPEPAEIVVAAPEPVRPRDMLAGSPEEIASLTSRMLSIALQDTYSDFPHDPVDQKEGKCDQVFKLGVGELGPHIRTVSVAVMKDEAGENAGLVIGDYEENISQKRQRAFSDRPNPEFGTIDNFVYSHKIWTV